ncbi:MAG: hypothetical protein EOO77_05380 [Oxalobacteraceae bacterium]|nr:MAG: hypothetical protein EOO77_05380 [Oxalobacteraceae bacterium]
MKGIVPSTSPKLKLEDFEKIVKKAKVTDECVMIGVRGYYAENKRGIYDDAILFRSPTAFLAVNANTDPSAWRKGIATLQTGVWRYKCGTHGLSHPVGPRRYAAFVQAAPVIVTRDGQGPQKPAYLGINIHHGSRNTTSSLGCQTVYPAQWDHFKATVYAELKKYNQKTFPYILINGEDQRVPVVQG